MTSIGPFQILSELGRGGMGVVYRALDGESGREVALKISTQKLNARRLARFQREGQLTANLQHVGIVRVHSSGDVDGRPYLAYELVQGESLDALLPGLDLRRRVELIRDAARALGYAHAQGVIHRDVKAGNILVDERGHVRVADFGLATAADLERLTQTGAWLGTPSHMAPEQVDGKGRAPTPALDVWSLGVLLYRALTGELPFVADTMVEFAQQILSCRYLPPSKRAPETPRALERVCAKALSLRSEDRHSDGAAFAEALDAWLEGRWTTQPRSYRWTLAAVPLLVGALGWAVSLAWGGSPERPPSGEPAPAGTPLAAKPASRFTSAQRASAERDLEKIGRIDDPRLRLKTARRWLDKHERFSPEDLQPARELARKAQLEFPLFAVDHAPEFDPELDAKTWKGDAFQVKAYFLDEKRLLTHGVDNKLRCWDLRATHKPQWELEASLPHIGIGVHPSGQWIAICGPKSPVSISVVDTTTREARAVPGLPDKRSPKGLAFSPDGKTLIIGFLHQGVRLYSWPALEHQRTLERDWIRGMDVSRDGRRLAISGGPWLDVGGPAYSEPNFIEVMDLRSGGRLLYYEPSTGQTVVALHPQGEWVLSGDTIGRVLAIKVDDPDQRHDLRAQSMKLEEGTLFSTAAAHASEVSAIVFSRDGRFAFTCNEVLHADGAIPELRVWDMQTLEEVRVVRPLHEDGLLSLSLSPSGRRLAVGTGGKLIEIYVTQGR